MSVPHSCLYRGEVVHRRLRPVRHELRYAVACLFVDIDELDTLSRRLRFFGRNGFNLMAVNDRNHGAGDGTSLASHAWMLARRHGAGAEISRIFMLCYPSMLGYVFNPLTIYFCLDAAGAVRMTLHEVNNTWGGRHTYVSPVFGDDGPASSQVQKAMAVSPFNRTEGAYRLTVSQPGDDLTVGVALSTQEGPLLAASFRGVRQDLTDTRILKTLFTLPLMTLKVFAGIHWEALKLWGKGMRLPRPHPDRQGGTEHGESG
jgi:DUF1365 family protein